MTTYETMTYTFHTDPGHGWLEVPTAALAHVGLTLSNVSEYSYLRRPHVFLEEDMDASVFVEAFRAKYGSEPRVQEAHVDGHHWIRNLCRCPA